MAQDIEHDDISNAALDQILKELMDRKFTKPAKGAEPPGLAGIKPPVGKGAEVSVTKVSAKPLGPKDMKLEVEPDGDEDQEDDEASAKAKPRPLMAPWMLKRG